MASCGRKIGQFDCCSVVCGDCLELMKSLPDGCVDAVITDPPYGVTQNKWDESKVTLQAFDSLSVPVVCTAQNPFSAELICRYRNRFKWSDVWKKTQAVGFLNAKVRPLRQHEDILVFCDGRMTYNPQISKKPSFNIRPHGNTAQSSNYGAFSEKRERSIGIDETYPTSIVEFANCQEGQHPTQKPVPLFVYLVASYSNDVETILDPFSGSGTTLVAAKKLGRHFLGFEISEEYCEIARKRLDDIDAQPSLFEKQPVAKEVGLFE